MPDFATLFLGGLCIALVLGWAYERQRNADQKRTDAAIKEAIAGLRAELKREAEYEATVKALGMMRNVAETRAAEPESLHPIVETKLAEAKLWELAEQRKRNARISEELNGSKP